ncbi:hypothetical protein [Piscirickettsia salmonis]|uniref:hypothetical protein n=1 Tax=Piscirickettsia salmonis TaxID=1238 RepID=UPI0012BA1092|nr:hypothetical protein [Piscirickettsia salmonis]
MRPLRFNKNQAILLQNPIQWLSHTLRKPEYYWVSVIMIGALFLQQATPVK